VWITTISTSTREILVVHRNVPLTETGRLRLARCVAEEGWPLRRAAERFQVSPTTAARWAARYRQAGAAGHETAPTSFSTARRNGCSALGLFEGANHA
jgi:transposase-like protein